jgi:hypothetical protein
MELNEIKGIIRVAIGEGSMCWNETPKSIFNIEKADKILEETSLKILNMRKKSLFELATIRELRENECRIYYKTKKTFLSFEKELKQLFKDNGFKMWASGFDVCDGTRDLCFEKKGG